MCISLKSGNLKKKLQLSSIRGARQDKSSFSRSFFLSELFKTLLALMCTSRSQALQIESHIKKMKIRRYILHLKQYPEIEKRPLDNQGVSRRLRSVADSNRRTRFCRPLPNHSANRPNYGFPFFGCAKITKNLPNLQEKSSLKEKLELA